jgi:hypothetical protein
MRVSLLFAITLLFTHLSFSQSQTSARSCFDDKELAQLEGSHTDALIYIWSPRMVLSALEAGNVAEAAKAKKIRFIALHDTRVGTREIAATLSKLNHLALIDSQALCSPRLISLEAMRHFPTAFIVRSGSLNTHPLVGAMPQEQLQHAIEMKQQQALAPTQVDISPNSGPPTQPQICIPPVEFVPLPIELAGAAITDSTEPRVALGSYERISPDGRFILRSYSGARIGDVSLIELGGEPTTSVVRIYETPLSNEAFPVQNTWRYIVSIGGQHYTLKEILTNQREAKSLFRAGITGFYTSAAELPSAPEQPAHLTRIRSFAWPNSSTSDLMMQGKGSLSVRTITVNTQNQTVEADSGTDFICGHRLNIDGPFYALPMISVDGQEFSALPQNPHREGHQTMHIYGFGKNGTGCEYLQHFDFSSGKAVFGFTEKEHAAHIAYEYGGHAWWFNRSLNLPFDLSPAPNADSLIHNLNASAFPGITRDGRVIYAATWDHCNKNDDANKVCPQEGGYVITDPWQSASYKQYIQEKNIKPEKACITQDDVRRERANFANFHQLGV